MAEEFTTEEHGYVVFTQYGSGRQRVLALIKAFKLHEQAETFKAIVNRDNSVRGSVLQVGEVICHFHNTDDSLDKLVVVPMNGDEEFHYSEMVDVKEIAAKAKGVK